MTKPQSYPFLAIAKMFNAPYGDVLLVADMWRHPERRSVNECEADKRMAKLLCGPSYDKDDVTLCSIAIAAANREFRNIQAGKIDWQTGEPVRADRGDEPIKGEEVNWSLRDRQAQSRALRPLPEPGGIIDYDSEGGPKRFKPLYDGEPEPGEHQEVIDALDYRNHEGDE